MYFQLPNIIGKFTKFAEILWPWKAPYKNLFEHTEELKTVWLIVIWEIFIYLLKGKERKEKRGREKKCSFMPTDRENCD